MRGMGYGLDLRGSSMCRAVHWHPPGASSAHSPRGFDASHLEKDKCAPSTTLYRVLLPAMPAMPVCCPFEIASSLDILPDLSSPSATEVRSPLTVPCLFFCNDIGIGQQHTHSLREMCLSAGARKLEIHAVAPPAKGMVVGGMYSADGELLPFLVPVSIHGSLDTWLAKVEAAMHATVQSRLQAVRCDTTA